MKRREFLKILCISPIIPGALAVRKKKCGDISSELRTSSSEEFDGLMVRSDTRKYNKRGSCSFMFCGHCDPCYADCPHYMQCHGIEFFSEDETYCFGRYYLGEII